MGDKFRTGPAFTSHVPCHPYGTDPSWNVKAIGQPAPIRQTSRFQWITRGNGSGVIGRMFNEEGVPIEAEAVIAVTHANVTPGTHLIRIGKFELRPAIDFAVGGNDNALATNLAAAINALPGYSAQSNLADCEVLTTSGHGDQHPNEVIEWGAASAFLLVALGGPPEYMDKGDPQVAPPLIA